MSSSLSRRYDEEVVERALRDPTAARRPAVALVLNEKHRRALILVAEARALVAAGDAGPAADVFRTLVDTFKSNMDDFMLRAERRRREMETLSVQRFSEQACALAQECRGFLQQVESGCDPAQSLRTLHMYEERLGGRFSARHFQALKDKACNPGASGASGASGAWGASGASGSSGSWGPTGVWNAARIQCQEVVQRLKELQQKEKGGDEKQNQQNTSAAPHGEVGMGKEEEGREAGEAGAGARSLTPPPTFQKEVVHTSEREAETPAVACVGRHDEPDSAEVQPESVEREEFPKHVERPPEARRRSEADLGGTPSGEGGVGFPPHRLLGRSLSEGASLRRRPASVSGFSPLNVRHKHCGSDAQEQNRQNGQQNLRDEQEGGGRSGDAQSARGLRTPETPLTASDPRGGNEGKAGLVLEELLSSERQYVKALGFVRQHYLSELERPDVPQGLRGQRASVFGNLEKLHDFHRHHFLRELERCADEPFRAGRCFLRHHKQLQLGDSMDLRSYLLKPVQRISKYSLLLQELRAACGAGRPREAAEVKAALEVVHFQLHHGNNLLAMDAIRHCDVNLKEQGQLIRQDEFTVTFRKRKCLRRVFLFQELILFSKTRKTDVGNETYIYKQSFKTSDVGMTQNSGDSGLVFEIWFRKRKTQDTYRLQAAGREAKDAWTRDLERILWEQAVHNREVRMQEREFMGIGNKPFTDIQPSAAAISDRAVSFPMLGRENRALSSTGSGDPRDGLPGGRPRSVGSGCSSSSSGRGSLVGYVRGPRWRGAGGGGLGGYACPPGALEEDDLDHESGIHNLLLDSSESSGESVSGFSSSGLSFHSAAGGEVEDAGFPAKEAGPPGRTPPPVAPKPKTRPQDRARDPLRGEVQNTSDGKSTEV
ncbi:Puratrophin-1 [Liparis tanakae]|uniref:Puratrophin-1 n=1 Tax=Liparis tanakae TaxID=230148 RepID=A0A4Z2GM72_9TELE|nr:Puratrophin-1 [Liparis tanakae]